MYSDTMFQFAAAADKLQMTISEVLDILDLTVEDAETEDLSVSDIVEAVEDAQSMEDFGCEDWVQGGDSCSHYCDA